MAHISCRIIIRSETESLSEIKEHVYLHTSCAKSIEIIFENVFLTLLFLFTIFKKFQPDSKCCQEQLLGCCCQEDKFPFLFVFLGFAYKVRSGVFCFCCFSGFCSVELFQCFQFWSSRATCFPALSSFLLTTNQACLVI